MNNLKTLFFYVLFALVAERQSLYAQIFKDKKNTSLAIRIPIGLSWWVPAEDDVRNSITGITGIRTGLELFPLGEGLSPEDRIFRLYARTTVN